MIRHHTKIQIAEIEAIAHKVLDLHPEPVPRYRLLREVLLKPPGDAEVREAQESLKTSQQVQTLVHEQRNDGSWGPFHSRDSRLNQMIPTTEAGVERALALGLTADHPVLQKAAAHILSILQGKSRFPDRHEKNDRWPTGMRLFLTATLSLIQPDHPLLTGDRSLWAEICRRTFASGVYSKEAEIRAHAELTGASVKDSYLVINGKYQLTLLGSIPGTLPRATETALMRWLWERPSGIGYLSVPLNKLPPGQRPGTIDRWLASHELLARRFPSWRGFATEIVDWLWRQRNEQGGWDFGARPTDNIRLPYSSDWRRSQTRFIDWTTRVLILLRQSIA